MPESRNFYVANMSFNGIRENKILVKIFGFIVLNVWKLNFRESEQQTGQSIVRIQLKQVFSC